MKSFNDDTASIYELKYENLFKIFDNSENISDKNELDALEDECEEEREEDEDHEMIPNEEEEEVEIEITSKEYKRKISNIIVKLIKAHKRSEISLEDQLANLVLSEVTEYRSIKLSKIIELLNEEYKIILDTIDIYCLYAKFRHDENDQNEYEEELIDCDKFIQEVNLMRKNENEDSTRFRGREEEGLETQKKTNEKLEKIITKSANYINSPRKSSKILKNVIESNSTNQIATADFIQLIRNNLKSNNISFEEFIKQEDTSFEKIKLGIINNQEDSEMINRYLDIKAFEKFLLTKDIIVLLHDPLKNDILKINRDCYNIKIDNEILFSENYINLDYLKYIIEEDHSEYEKKTYLGYALVKRNKNQNL